MDVKDNTFYPLIILFFFLGLVIGYVIHQPATVMQIKYVNNTIEKIVEKTPEATVSSTSALPTAAPTAVADFIVKESYDPSMDIPTETIDLANWRAFPDVVTIHPGESVVIRITASSLPGPITLVLNSTYKRNIGTSGAAFIIFNKKGTYTLKAIIPNPDPNVIPTVYADNVKIIVN